MGSTVHYADLELRRDNLTRRACGKLADWGGLTVIPAMSQADAKNLRLSSKRSFRSFHFLRDHR